MLRPPYFYSVEWNSDVNMIAYNFGAIGSVIGHEIIHGFDDQGRQFDKNGDLNNWWDDVSGKKYMEMAEKIGERYSEFKINPELTMGENIADIGGLRISLSGLILFLKESNIPNLSEDIMNYFIKGWAMIWRNKITKQEYDIRILKDPHSPVEQRVNIPLSFIKELKDNEKNKNEIIEIW
jgi:putative endopeptidase